MASEILDTVIAAVGGWFDIGARTHEVGYFPIDDTHFAQLTTEEVAAFEAAMRECAAKLQVDVEISRDAMRRLTIIAWRPRTQEGS